MEKVGRIQFKEVFVKNSDNTQTVLTSVWGEEYLQNNVKKWVLTCDGSVQADIGIGGIGGTLSDEEGVTRAVFSKTMDLSTYRKIGGAAHLEWAALENGLLLARQAGVTSLEVQTDCIEIVDALALSLKNIKNKYKLMIGKK